MRVKDMKIREMITMIADIPVDEIARLFTEHRIGDCRWQTIRISDWHCDRERSFTKGKRHALLFF